ncbi:MAG: non-canonical purine NTP diphosphatase [Cytophagales bacterium]|nr:non-canonical purine NTP diphosphatase [Cytophagales bacterium]
MKLCMATNNAHKIEEIKPLVPESVGLVSLAEVGCREELPETGDTLEANSRQKAQYVWDHYGVSCFADDSGLEVEALRGEPGVYSARYAGPERDARANMELLLRKLEGEENRRAQFRTSITLLLDGRPYQFEGVVRGAILGAPRGTGGFGYDPLFVPDGYAQTFAEMDLSEKNKISHRARAVEGLIRFLRERAE